MTPSRPLTRTAVFGIAMLLVVLVRTAWVCDDSYITFRTADNLVHGYGPVWNTDERVQAFTHPLWLGVFTSVYAVTREPYYTAIALGMLLTLGTAALLRRTAVAPGVFVVCLAALVSSKAFVDFSTSGLENALSHLLLTWFLWHWWTDEPGTRRLGRLSLIAGLCLLNRMDLALLVGPALAVDAWRLGPRAAMRPLFTGLMPFFAWELFSVFYYGSPVPNTAYAKLNIGFPPSTLFARGLDYVHRTLVSDPITLPVIVVAPLLMTVRRSRDWPLAAGVALSLLYVLRIGGDFMMGRFFTAPFVMSVVMLARFDWLAPPRRSWGISTAVVAVGLAAPWEPALLSGYGYARLDNLLHGITAAGPRDESRFIYLDDVMDERRYYYEATGLLKGRPWQQRPDHPMVADGLELRQGANKVVTRDGVGFTGYFAGPDVHIVDVFALTDPLLARLPAQPGSRTGHYRRDIPAGYLESIESGTNRIADPNLAAYYDRLRLVTAGPLWSRERLLTVAGLLAGRYNHGLDSFLGRETPADRPSHR